MTEKQPVKSRVYILAASAVTSGLISEFVPLPFGASYLVGMALFPIMFCTMVIFLWDGASFIQQAGLLAGAFLLGYVAEESAVVLRNGVRVFSNMTPSLILLLLRFACAFFALAIGHAALRVVRRRDA